MGFVRSFRRRLKKNRSTAKKKRLVHLEPLEPRILLSADLSHTMGGSGHDLTLRLGDVDGVNTLQLINPTNPDPGAQVVASQALADTSGIEIIGSDQDDTLRIDLDFDLVPENFRINFQGGAGEDTLVGPATDWDRKPGGRRRQ
jgi:hypothetical protein